MVNITSRIDNVLKIFLNLWVFMFMFAGLSPDSNNDRSIIRRRPARHMT
jgi:hypothetical protein